jgi:predicted dehydrogenase
MSSLQVAVVGFGSIGRRHLENLARLGVQRRLLVRRAAAANPAFQPPHDVRVVYNHAAAIDAGLDLAIVANPTRLHVETAINYMEAGVPVLLEKPVSDDLGEAERLLLASQAGGVPCGVAYCMRYHPAYALAQQAIVAGRLGEVRFARAWFDSYLPSWHPWEDYRDSYAARRDLGGGVLPTLDHEIDFLLWCLGPPESAEGFTARSGLLDAPVDDLARLDWRYADGGQAEIELSFCRPQRERGFEFVGEQGSLRFSFDDGDLVFSDDRDDALLWSSGGYDLNQMYVHLLAAALAAIESGEPFPIPLSAGIAALRVVTPVAGAC